MRGDKSGQRRLRLSVPTSHLMLSTTYTFTRTVKNSSSSGAYKTPRASSNKVETKRYRARKPDCDVCTLKTRCCPKEPQRKVTRSIFETSRHVARALAQTKQYSVSCKLRKKVDMSFAHLKRIHGLGRLRLRDPCGAHDAFILAATAQSLKKLAKLVPQGSPITKAT